MKSTSLERAALHFIARKDQSGKIPRETGIAVSVVHGSEALFQGSFGLRDREAMLPVTSKTVFDVSSITKGFAATALLIAERENRLHLDEPINSSAELVPLKDARVSQQLSFVDILSHRTGLPSHDPLWYFGTETNRAERLRHLDLIPGGFRNGFLYNNLMYGCLSRCFDEGLRESFESYVTRKLLAPLNMTSASMKPPSPDENAAIPYAGDQKIPRKDMTSMAPAGALRMNIEDLGRWIAFNLSSGKTASGEELLSAEAMRRVHQPHISIKDPNPLIMQGLEWLGSNPDYGLGWFLGETRGMKAWYHPGLIDGFSAAVVLVPELNLGFSVLTNTNLSPLPGLMIQDLLCAVLEEAAPENPTDLASTLPNPTPQLRPDTVCSAVGRYEDAAYGMIEVQQTGSGYCLRYNGYEWPLTFHSFDEAVVILTAFGIQLPLPAKFVVKEGTTVSVKIPFSFDSKLPQNFTRY